VRIDPAVRKYFYAFYYSEPLSFGVKVLYWLMALGSGWCELVLQSILTPFSGKFKKSRSLSGKVIPPP